MACNWRLFFIIAVITTVCRAPLALLRLDLGTCCMLFPKQTTPTVAYQRIIFQCQCEWLPIWALPGIAEAEPGAHSLWLLPLGCFFSSSALDMHFSLVNSNFLKVPEWRF